MSRVRAQVSWALSSVPWLQERMKVTLYLREPDVEKLLTIGEVVTTVERAFQRLGQRLAVNAPRQAHHVGAWTLRSMAAAVDGVGLGLKTYTLGGKGVRFVVVLWDHVTGELQAVVEGNRVTQLRTGAVSGVATKYLAQHDAARVAIYGSGWQARTQLEAVCIVRPVDHVLVYSPNPVHREAFAQEMSAALGLPVEAVGVSREAIVSADIVITVTPSRQPVFDGRWLQPGVHINVVGGHSGEIDIETTRRANLIAVDDLDQARIEAVDLVRAVEEGLLTWDSMVALSDIVTGLAPGRQSDTDITLFESLGTAVADVAVARLAYEKARQLGAGDRISTRQSNWMLHQERNATKCLRGRRISMPSLLRSCSRLPGSK